MSSSIFDNIFGKKKPITDDETNFVRSIGITGSIGLVGTELSRRLTKKGFNVIKIKITDDKITPTLSSLEGLEGIIHLAGLTITNNDNFTSKYLLIIIIQVRMLLVEMNKMDYYEFWDDGQTIKRRKFLSPE